jgi:hypothetical protein
MEGASAVLDSLFHLHDTLFARVTAMEAGRDAPEPFIVNLLANVEGELARHHIVAIRPRPGDAINLDVMFLAGSAPCAWWREPDRVARVMKCGFACRHEGAYEVIRKAHVEVYRRT